MTNSPIDRNKLIERASNAFRVRGYEGTSLSHLVEATGLQRAGLYHHFPGGKAEIAHCVMHKADEHFATHVLAPLTSSDADAKTKVVEIGERLTECYQSGEKSCLLNAFSFDVCGALGEHVGNSFAALLNAFAGLARSSGFSETEASKRAEDAMIRIQGALVFARAAKNNRPFLRVMSELPELLIE